MMRSRCCCRRRAITLAELLVAIGLLGVFALAATQLFHATIRIGHATAQQQDTAGSFDAALNALRGDVWIASEIAATDATAAKLGNVTWTIRDTTLTRVASDGTPPRTWPVPKGTVFITEGGGGGGVSLVLRLPAADGQRGGDVRMVSETLVRARLTAP